MIGGHGAAQRRATPSCHTKKMKSTLCVYLEANALKTRALIYMKSDRSNAM